MTRCPFCNEEIAGAGRFCASCGTVLDASAVPTVAMAPRTPPSSSSSDEGRFPAGTVLGERYRILGLLGRGGMGEVYRAFDLKLDQTVALKFLPAATSKNARLLERFRGEVRIARQVSHRNVCRVHDIGDVDGAAFISMEYVDGEDLGSLLRRIGRLPGDKAIEFSRRLCAGLAAAHEKGVLHRDLKPTNIMIDGRGQVLIMDFGLAAAADAIAGGDIRSGTPAYMAPEQKEGREVTVRSDVYSLGLVMQEMFLGRDSASAPKDLDPAVERVIRRCLDANPKNRPASALDLARALPGGDPLAEALAAGDTPSPEMVAASEDTGALSVRAAVVCLISVFVGLIIAIALGNSTSILRMTPVPDPPEVLARKARDLANTFGYTDPPMDSVFRFDLDNSYNEWANANLKLPERRAQLAQGQPPVILLWYRQSPQPLVPTGWDSVSSTDPPPLLPGDIEIHLDPQGHLQFFHAVALDTAVSTERVNWSSLFDAAGLDQSRWSPAEPERTPVLAFDQRAAWTGVYPSAFSSPIRIEAASWKGRPVYFEVSGPWTPPRPVTVFNSPPWIMVAALMSLPLFLAWRNLQRGKGDVGGASFLAVFLFACSVLGWLISSHNRLNAQVGPSILTAVCVWILYMALEPYVRRRWPQSLISWSRVLSGGLNDPMVGGHVLMGVALGILFAILTFSNAWLALQNGQLINVSSQPLSGMSGAIAGWMTSFNGAVVIPFFVLYSVFILRVALRLTWLAASVVIAGAGLLGYGSGNSVYLHVFGALIAATQVLTLLRFGVLPTMVATVVVVELSSFPPTSDFSAWYAGPGIILLVIIVALALWSFRNALGGRKVWKGDILEN